MPAGEDRPRLICRCLGVASPRVYAAVRAGRLDSVAAITKALRAGGGCTLCHAELEELLAEVRGAPIEPGLALENQAVCREETRARIAGALASLVQPRLAGLGAALEAWEVEGLRVRVRLSGRGSEEALALVREKLRRHVCADLEVERLGAAG
jgi:NifU-like protein